jgi:hypothetical protein
MLPLNFNSYVHIYSQFSLIAIMNGNIMNYDKDNNANDNCKKDIYVLFAVRQQFKL